MLITYLETLKTKGNFTYKSIADLSGIPEGTVRNVFTEKTSNPQFDTISAIVTAMGGSLDAINAASTKKEDIEANSIITIKETYEARIKELNEQYQQRIAETKEHYEQRITEINEHIATIQLDKRWFRIAMCICALALVVLFVAELIIPGIDWKGIRY